MSFLASFTGNIINFTANLIVAVAIHIPFLLSALTGATVISPQQMISPSAVSEAAHSTPADISTPIVLATSTVTVSQTYQSIGSVRVITDVASSTSKKYFILNHPQGESFSNEDAARVLHDLGFGTGSDDLSIQEDTAKLTGSGKAWFIIGMDRHASTSFCPPLGGGGWTNFIDLSFEMNEATGNININSICRPVMVDF
jgi:hypothetical protein